MTMQDYNKKNLKRLIALFSAALVFFLAAITATVSIRWWWASLPTSGMAIAAAVFIFKKGYLDKEKEGK